MDFYEQYADDYYGRFEEVEPVTYKIKDKEKFKRLKEEKKNVKQSNDI